MLPSPAQIWQVLSEELHDEMKHEASLNRLWIWRLLMREFADWNIGRGHDAHPWLMMPIRSGDRSNLGRAQAEGAQLLLLALGRRERLPRDAFGDVHRPPRQTNRLVRSLLQHECA